MKETFSEQEKQNYINHRIARAKETLEICDDMVRSKHYNAAMGRLYYACYYVLKALFLKENIDASTHQGIKAMLGLHFISTGKLLPRYGALFSQLMNNRTDGDYGDFIYFTAEDIQQLRPQVDDFITVVVTLINS